MEKGMSVSLLMPRAAVAGREARKAEGGVDTQGGNAAAKVDGEVCKFA